MTNVTRICFAASLVAYVIGRELTSLALMGVAATAALIGQGDK